jgi:hypothetical protein
MSLQRLKYRKRKNFDTRGTTQRSGKMSSHIKVDGSARTEIIAIKHYNMKIVFLVFISVLGYIYTYSQPSLKKSLTIKAGFITAVVNGDSVVGMYEMFENYNPKYRSFERTMYFNFRGKRFDDTTFFVKVVSDDRVINGTFILKDSSFVYLSCIDDEPYGYANFSFVYDGYKSDFIIINNIEAIKEVIAKKAAIYTKPHEKFKSKMYLERSDYIKVHSTIAGWHKMSYFNYI